MTQMQETQSHWSDVDGARDPSVYTRYLDTVRTLDAADAYKACSIEMLRLSPTSVALDAGCGTGEDARRMAERCGPLATVWGIDASAALVAESMRRAAGTGLPVSFRPGSVTATGFDDATFDAIRSDRVFQHVEEPEAALAELVRILKPGGRIALSDPDWGTYLVDGPRTDAMKTYLALVGSQAKNPWMGRRLYPLFRAAGLAEVEVAAHTLVFLDYPLLERIGGLDDDWAAALLPGSALTARDFQAIRDDLRARHEQGRFFACVTVFTVCATTASSPANARRDSHGA